MSRLACSKTTFLLFMLFFGLAMIVFSGQKHIQAASSQFGLEVQPIECDLLTLDNGIFQSNILQPNTCQQAFDVNQTDPDIRNRVLLRSEDAPNAGTTDLGFEFNLSEVFKSLPEVVVSGLIVGVLLVIIDGILFELAFIRTTFRWLAKLFALLWS